MRELRAAIAELEGPGRSLRLAERRSAFLSDKWEVYAQLALVERQRNRPGSAFEASERLRAREMLELLARGRIGAPSGAGAPLIARAQDLQRRMAELATASNDGVGGVSGAALRGPAERGGGGPRQEALTETRRRTRHCSSKCGKPPPDRRHSSKPRS